MNNNEDEVSNILSAKLSIKFSDVEIDAMKVCTSINQGTFILQYRDKENIVQ